MARARQISRTREMVSDLVLNLLDRKCGTCILGGQPAHTTVRHTFENPKLALFAVFVFLFYTFLLLLQNTSTFP